MSQSSRRPRPSRSTVAAAPQVPLPILLLIGGIVVIGAIIAIAVYNTVQDRTVSTAAIEGVQVIPGLERNHVEGTVQYKQTPPAGGPHNAVWQNCGIYDQPIIQEHAVHSLEHGAVWITYRPDLPADQVEILRSQVRGNGYALLSPYPELPVPIVASAWGIQLQLDEAGDPRLNTFLRKYMQGPQTPELGAACVQGTGTPIER
jgi:hypothetical protein